MNGRMATTGVYFYRMTSGKYSATKKMIMAK
ncbi:MAG: T9SS type A sorting domain-containing protein [Candidatus Cloacimonetes bacterium]|nr:T9SS type A sorting domain-containing protein [Candidatus Cloacimonadota bacterium]